MKNKYQRMNKNEKRKIKDEYKRTKSGKTFYKNYINCITISTLGILYSIYLFIDTYVKKTSKFFYYYVPVIIIICIIFIICIIKQKNKRLNEYAIKKDKS